MLQFYLVILSLFGGEVIFIKNAIPNEQWLPMLTQEITFPAQRPIILYGVNVLEPRDVAFYGDPRVEAITYSNITRNPLPWTPTLLRLRNYLQKHFVAVLPLSRMPHNPILNCVLINRYVNGQDSIIFWSNMYFTLVKKYKATNNKKRNNNNYA